MYSKYNRRQNKNFKITINEYLKLNMFTNFN